MPRIGLDNQKKKEPQQRPHGSERETMRMKRRRPETNVIEMNMEGEEESVRGEETGLEAEVKAERGAQPEDLHAGDAGKLGTSQGSV